MNNLTHHKTTSCGCYKRELCRQANLTHGQTGTPEYRAWAGMKKRCYNVNDKWYQQWGGRGITVCDEWKDDFATFLADMGPRPSGRHSLDRIDNKGSYSKANCRWATPREQAANTSVCVLIEHDGERLPMAEWGRRIGATGHVVALRLKRGWPISRAVTEKSKGTPFAERR